MPTSRLAIFFALIPRTVFAGKGCRVCDCVVTFRSWGPKYDRDEASAATRQWVRQFVAGGDFQQFSMVTTSQPEDCDEHMRCDMWEGYFTAWRLCSNGAAYSCGVGGSYEPPRYEIVCNHCESRRCDGPCTLECTLQPRP